MCNSSLKNIYKYQLLLGAAKWGISADVVHFFPTALGTNTTQASKHHNILTVSQIWYKAMQVLKMKRTYNTSVYLMAGIRNI